MVIVTTPSSDALAAYCRVEQVEAERIERFVELWPVSEGNAKNERERKRKSEEVMQ
jgi:hypothetical protein